MAGFKIKFVHTGAVAFLFCKVISFEKKCFIYAECFASALSTSNGLEEHRKRCTFTNSLHLGGYVRKNGNLGRNIPLIFEIAECMRNSLGGFNGVFYGVDTEAKVTGTERNSFLNAKNDGFRIVGTGVALCTERKSSGKTDLGFAAGRSAAFACAIDKVGSGADFCDCCNGFTDPSIACAVKIVGSGLVIHDPFTNFCNGIVFELIIHAFVHGVNFNSGNLVFFVRNNGVFGDVFDSKLAENYFSCNFFGNSFRSNSEVSVAGFRLVSFCENVFDITEFISFSVKSGFQFQGENSFPFSVNGRKLVNLYFPFYVKPRPETSPESRT